MYIKPYQTVILIIFRYINFIAKPYKHTESEMSYLSWEPVKIERENVPERWYWSDVRDGNSGYLTLLKSLSVGWQHSNKSVTIIIATIQWTSVDV